MAMWVENGETLGRRDMLRIFALKARQEVGSTRAIGGVPKHEDQSTDVLLEGFKNITTMSRSRGVRAGDGSSAGL